MWQDLYPPPPLTPASSRKPPSNYTPRKAASRRQVYRDASASSQTKGGLTQADLTRSKDGRRIVSRKLKDIAIARLPGSPFDLFREAREIVRASNGFRMVCLGGKTLEGQRFLALTRVKYTELKAARGL